RLQGRYLESPPTGRKRAGRNDGVRSSGTGTSGSRVFRPSGSADARSTRSGRLASRCAAAEAAGRSGAVSQLWQLGGGAAYLSAGAASHGIETRSGPAAYRG